MATTAQEYDSLLIVEWAIRALQLRRQSPADAFVGDRGCEGEDDVLVRDEMGMS